MSIRDKLLNAVAEKLKREPKEVASEFVGFFEMIQVPESFRGFIRVMDTLIDITEQADSEISTKLKLPKQHYVSLTEVLKCSDFLNDKGLTNSTMAKGWCEDNPFYALLFSYRKFEDRTGRPQFVAAFIQHYCDLLKNSHSIDFAGVSPEQRLKDACGVFRLLMGRCPHLIVSRYASRNPDDIALLLEDDRNTTRGLIDCHKAYMLQLAHFFAADWDYIKGGRGRRTNVGLRRRGEKKFPTLPGEPDVLIHFSSEPSSQLLVPDIDPDDLTIFPTFIEDRTMKARDKTELPHLSNIRSPARQRQVRASVSQKIKRKFSPSLTSTQLITPAGIASLLSDLMALSRKRGEVQGVPRTLIASALYLSFVLGRPLDELKELVVSREKGLDGIYIDGDNNWWLYFSVSASIKPSNIPADTSLFLPVENSVVWKCPDSIRRLVSHAIEKPINEEQSPLIPDRYVKDFEHACRQWLKSRSKRTNSSVNCDMVAAFVHNFLLAQEGIDLTVLDFAFRSSYISTRTTRHYSYYSYDNLASSLSRLWHHIYDWARRPEDFPPDLLCWSTEQSEGGVGSHFVPSDDSLRTMVSQMMTDLSNQKAVRLSSLDSIIKYHNAYVTYIAFMVLHATGYRAVYNPLPALSLVLERFNCLVISDKDNSDYLHTRVVCLPTVLAMQIEHYREHIEALRTYLAPLNQGLGLQISMLLREHEVGTNSKQAEALFSERKNSRKDPGPLFYISDSNNHLSAQVVSPTWLKARLQVDIPVNAGRHSMRSYLLAKRIRAELINFQLGHWLSGQAFLANYSTFDYQSATQELLPLLDDMLEGHGWQALPTNLR